MDDVRRAWEARDPELVRLVVALSAQPDEKPETPARQGAPTFARFLNEVRGWQFRRKSKEEQRQFRVTQLQALEAADAEVPLPERLRLYDVILKLWEDNGPFARDCLLKVIGLVKLTY